MRASAAVLETQRILGESVKTATEEDWYTEYLGPILAIKVVTGMDEAIEHINKYGSYRCNYYLKT